MKIKTVLRKSPLYAVASFGMLLLSSCFPSFNSAEEVMEYLKKEFPNHDIVLSSEYKTSRGLWEDWRIWSFTLSGYPKDTFQVASHIGSYPFPMMKTNKSIISNFYKVVTLRREREFEQGPLKAFDAPTRRIWHRFPHTDFSLRAVQWEVETLDDIWRAKRLIDAFEQFLSEEKVGNHAHYYLRMYMQGPCYALGGGNYIDFMDNLETAEPGEKSPCYIEYHIYGDINRQEVCQMFYNSVMRFHQLMADQGNGVTKENFQEWAEQQLRLKAHLTELSTEEERDSLRKVLVVDDDDVRRVFIDMGQKPYMMVTLANSDMRPNSRGIFFTYPQLRVFCLRSGLRVQGTGDHFTVKGVDGSSYEFSIRFYEEKKDVVGFEEDTCYYLRDGRKVVVQGFWSPEKCVNDALVRRITGRDVRQMVVHEIKQ